MDDRRNARRGRRSNNALLLAVLIGFCILAIIEIFYGQARIRVEKERLALEEQNKQAVQEIQSEWNALKDSSVVVTDEVKSETNVSQNTEREIVPDRIVEDTAENVVEDTGIYLPASVSGNEAGVSGNTIDDGCDMQIVFLGDSILDNDRGNDGVAALIAESCNARVYNMAMGGTTAALLPGERYDYDNWDSRSLLGVVNAIVGNVDGGFLSGYRAGEILKECDFSKTDYFVLEYGINDFLSRRIPQSVYLADGGTLALDRYYTYSGALFTAVGLLQNKFPDAKIVIFAPHYCQIFEGETFMGDAYSIDYGYGTLIDFARCAGYVYDQSKENNVLLYFPFENCNITALTADEYLEDGVHLSEAGRREYADNASRLIKSDFYREE